MKQRWALILETENHSTSPLGREDLIANLLFWLGDGPEQPDYKFNLTRVTDLHEVTE